MSKRTVVGFLLLVSGACLLLLALSFNVSGEMEPYHINLKSGDTLSPETYAELEAAGNSVHVEAQYEEPIFPGGGRNNKEWVEAGNWSSEDRAFNFSMGGSVTFNVWYSIRDEGYDAGPEFRFRLYQDGEELVQVTGPVGQDDGSNLTEYTATGNFDTKELKPEEELRMRVEYRAWEDCDLHFDNATCDSGFVVDSDFLRIPVLKVKETNITMELFDAFETDWEEAASFFNFTEDDEAVGIKDVAFSTGEKHEMGNTTVTATRVVWTLNESLDDGDSVRVWTKYTLAEEGEDKGAKEYYLVKEEEEPEDPDDEDDDEGEFLPGFEILGLLVAFGVGGLRRRR